MIKRVARRVYLDRARQLEHGLLAELVPAIGREAVMQMIEARGGGRVDIPAQGSPWNAETEAAIGAAAAAQLQAMAPGLRLTVPLAKEWRAAVLRAQGVSADQVALRLGITRSTAFEFSARARQRIEQGDLFVPRAFGARR